MILFIGLSEVAQLDEQASLHAVELCGHRPVLLTGQLPLALVDILDCALIVTSFAGKIGESHIGICVGWLFLDDRFEHFRGLADTAGFVVAASQIEACCDLES